MELTNEHFEDFYFRFCESNYIEFKESVCHQSFQKYIETICAFLNTGGGYLIFGIRDDAQMVGLEMNRKTLDTFKCKIDSILHQNLIIGTNMDNKPEILNVKNIQLQHYYNSRKQLFIFIFIQSIPCENITYKIRTSGLAHYRLSASNYCHRDERFYNTSEYNQAYNTLDEINRNNIQLFQTTLQKKEMELQKKEMELQKKETELQQQNANIANLQAEISIHKTYINNCLEYYKQASQTIHHILPCFR
jgi:predicted HTH transcriptional regulator